jgi:hypothetical protein
VEESATRVVIPSRFRGPTTSGNGGYTCGIVAGILGGVAEVMLRRPPPLERPLEVVHRDGVVLLDGDEVVAHGRSAVLDLAVPPPPSFEKSERKAQHYTGFSGHPFPECFVCGPARTAGDGLRIFAGRETGDPLVAAPWVPDPSMCDSRGRVDARILWAALDCPGYFAIESGETAVLGKMTAEVRGSVRAGERCVVTGWSLGQEGRKLHTATALFSTAGEIIGRSRQVWVKLAG